MSNWTEMFDKKGDVDTLERARQDPHPAKDDADSFDSNEYRPWLLQRGTNRPVMFIDLRWFEPKTGAAVGCQLSYPHLIAIDYIADRLVSLDFGGRRFVVEGSGLDALTAHLQLGQVTLIQEYSSIVWPTALVGPRIDRLVEIRNQFQEHRPNNTESSV